MGQLLNYIVYVSLALQLDSSSEGIRLFMCCFGVRYHSYLSAQPQHFPIRDTVTIFTVSYIGTKNHFSTAVIIPDAATCCTGGHSATVVVIPYAAACCMRGHSATVVIIPSSVTSGARDSFLR